MPRQKKNIPVYSTSPPREEEEEDEKKEITVASQDFALDDDAYSTASSDHGGNLSYLFDRLELKFAEMDSNPQKIFANMRDKRFTYIRTAMYHVLAERKGELGPLLTERAREVEELNHRTAKLDNMLFDCLAGADLGPPSPEPGETIVNTDAQYKIQLQAIKFKHTAMLEELEQSRGHTEGLIDNIMEIQIPFRPITKQDHKLLKDATSCRYTNTETKMKRETVNAVLLINEKCMDARRRRKNFTKDTTDILTEWFNDHIDHPYPTDEEKNLLADHCRISVAQITNWFGNRRVRQKRQADRPLQPLSPKKKGSPQSSKRGGKQGHGQRGRPPQNQQHKAAAPASPQVQQQHKQSMQQVLQQQQPRQMVAMPGNQSMVRQLTDGQIQEQAMLAHSFHMDQFDPQGMHLLNGNLMSDHYQLDHIMNSSGITANDEMHHTVGDKSYTDL